MIYIMIGILVVGGVIWWFLSSDLSKRRSLRAGDKKRVRENWSRIEAMAKEDTEAGWRQAIVEADKLLNFVLAQKGVEGQTLGERLINGKLLFTNVQTAWEAHKVRNQIAHEVDFHLTDLQISQTLEWFKDSLRQLKAL